MSDSIEELARRYVEDVQADQHPRSIGLFPIPEYPELEAERGMWSAALDAILTTLRYLAPATLLTLLWGQQSFLLTLLRHIDNAFRAILGNLKPATLLTLFWGQHSLLFTLLRHIYNGFKAIVFSSEEQKQAVLQWLCEAGSVRVERLDTVWQHGWVLCGVLDSYLPGACAGHPPTRLSLKHAQAIADHYLGVEPVFSRQELESNDSLSKHQEWRLATYLERVREALSKITLPVSKPTSQRTSPETTQFTLDYVAKGSGLTAAQVNHKMSFKIYPTAQQTLDPGDITILIRGPKDTYGMTVLSPILGKAQKIRQKLLGLQSKQTFTENALPITQGATYLRSYGKNDMNKTYYIPKTAYAIEIEYLKREDHTKMIYKVPLEGKYEVSITTRGQNIVGSPFIVTASYNIIGILEKENFCLEDGEEIDIVDVKTDRKVVLRIVDFVTEKMLLRENGALEKITEDEAKLLMSTDVEHERSSSVTEIIEHFSSKIKEKKSDKFIKIAQKVMKMNRVCKAFDYTRNKKDSLSQYMKKENSFVNANNQNDIPDIVNSTLSESNVTSFMISEKRDKFIVPENISVSIRTEKAKPIYEEKVCVRTAEMESISTFENVLSNVHDHSMTSCTPDSLEKILEEDQPEDDNILIDRVTSLSRNNPFLTDISEDFTIQKKLGTYVKTEYQRNNSQNEEVRDSSIKIIVEENDTSSPLSITNPFLETDVRELERPKTPIYKIITGDVTSRIDSPYLEPKNELVSEEMLSNEFVNPFFMHQMQSSQHFDQPPITDFIIGAPVSLPPMIRAPSPEPAMEALASSQRRNLNYETKHDDKLEEVISPSVFSTPLHTLPKHTAQTAITSTFHSLDSSLSDPIDNSNASTSSDNQYPPYRIDSSKVNRDVSPRKDIWDSAYVSIDDSSGSPDNNNNENTISDSLNKQKFSLSNDSYEQQLSNMGPAERELWETCGELNDTHKIEEEGKPYKWEIKRPIFTPIIEESDRSISSGLKDSLKHQETDLVTVAFAELNDVYEEYFPNSENSSTTVTEDKLQKTEVGNMIETVDTSVESASEESDVIRHESEQEGTISEVQANVTESISVSHTLRNQLNRQSHTLSSHSKNETQFGDKNSNIVLEKKKYWDERIRQIEAKTEEITKYHKKKRISAKQLKHDSLSKRKGKQIVKNFLNAGNEEQVQITKQLIVNKPEVVNNEPARRQEDKKSEVKLVEKWKKYWDEKLISESDEPGNEIRSTSPRCPSKSPQRYKEKPALNISDVKNISKLSVPVKQELPEEIFKAFETSPKRFFGTSRKHILNKIDTFIGKPSSSEENSPTEMIEIGPDSGLVSSRISLFHNLTNTEPLPWMQRKSKSMHNIYQKKESEKDITFEERSDTEQLQRKTDQKSYKAAAVMNVENLALTPERISTQYKRARLAQTSFNISFDETEVEKSNTEEIKVIKPTVYKTAKDIYIPTHIDKYKKNNVLRKTSISKSEMDIFSKVPVEPDDGLDKHKSYDELPKINVKSFISLYEKNVSMPSEEAKPVKQKYYMPCSVDSLSINSDAEKKSNEPSHSRLERSRSRTGTPEVVPRVYSRTSKISESTSIDSVDIKTDTESLDIDITSKNSERKETTYVSLSDIELEIVENSPDKSKESKPDNTGQPHIDYKNRFKQAKQYFQSLEELREDKKPKKLNECEMLLLNKSSESLDEEKPQKRLKKKKKSHSMPSSELAKYWTQMQENQKEEPKESKLVKISEKFQVEDLFTDVMEGRLSRQGSLRGIPHKKAVLEAFRSMENISDSKMTAYEADISQISDFTNGTLGKNAQSYLKEYPYLPTTDPSKFHSRLDAKASGLITLKELLENKVRRNSVPDLRLNAKFSADL